MGGGGLKAGVMNSEAPFDAFSIHFTLLGPVGWRLNGREERPDMGKCNSTGRSIANPQKPLDLLSRPPPQLPLPFLGSALPHSCLSQSSRVLPKKVSAQHP